MKTKLVVLMLLAAGAVFGQLSVGIRIGPPRRYGWFGFSQEVPALAMFGSAATGTRWAAAIRGTPDIGLALHTPARTGWNLVMMASAILKATGMAIAARSPTTTVQTTTAPIATTNATTTKISGSSGRTHAAELPEVVVVISHRQAREPQCRTSMSGRRAGMSLFGVDTSVVPVPPPK